METYWTNSFPVELLARMFSVPERPGLRPAPRSAANLGRREFAAVLSSGTWIAPLSFSSPEAWLEFLRRKQVGRIEIGPCMDNVASLRATQAQQDSGARVNADGEFFDEEICVVGTELRVDVDADDLRRVRGCCHGKKSLCSHCWFLCVTTARVLDYIFRVEFLFKHVLWVFSGRRGLHGWVCDPDAVEYTGASRRRVVDTYAALTGHVDSLVLTRDAVVSRAAAAASFLASEDALFQRHADLLDTVLLPALAEAEQRGVPAFFTEERIAAGPSSEKLRMVDGGAEIAAFIAEGVWILYACCVVPLLAGDNAWALGCLEERYASTCELGAGLQRTMAEEFSYIGLLVREARRKHPEWPETEEQVLLRIRRRASLALLARLDAPVTLQISHKLKIPFSVHPSTGCVGVPFRLSGHVWEDPCGEAPRAAQLGPRWEEHVQILREHVEGVERARREREVGVRKRLRDARVNVRALQDKCAARMAELVEKLKT